MTNSHDLKELPFAPTKKKLHTMYWQLPTSYLTKQINTILLSYGESKFKKTLNNKQFKELINVLGIPKYYKEFD